MHLCFFNIPNLLMYSSTCTEDGLGDIECFSRREGFRAVDKDLRSWYIGVPESARRSPYILEYKRWKAPASKRFIIFSKVPALYNVLTKTSMDGLWTYFQLGTTLCKWGLTEAEVQLMGKISHRFFSHMRDSYYQLREDRLYFMRLVFHEIIYLEDRTRSIGPLSILSQFFMENLLAI